MKVGDVIVDRDGDAGRITHIDKSDVIIDYQVPWLPKEIFINVDNVVTVIEGLGEDDAMAYIRMINRMQ